jgi:uncharacterized protein
MCRHHHHHHEPPKSSTPLSAVWRVVNTLPILLIRFYQLAISPLFPPSCRFTPSCSGYAIDAFKTHHFFYALALTVWRVLRCNPFVKGGYDPVPPRKT